MLIGLKPKATKSVAALSFIQIYAKGISNGVLHSVAVPNGKMSGLHLYLWTVSKVGLQLPFKYRNNEYDRQLSNYGNKEDNYYTLTTSFYGGGEFVEVKVGF